MARARGRFPIVGHLWGQQRNLDDVVATDSNRCRTDLRRGGFRLFAEIHQRLLCGHSVMGEQVMESTPRLPNVPLASGAAKYEVDVGMDRV